MVKPSGVLNDFVTREQLFVGMAASWSISMSREKESAIIAPRFGRTAGVYPCCVAVLAAIVVMVFLT